MLRGAEEDLLNLPAEQPPSRAVGALLRQDEQKLLASIPPDLIIRAHGCAHARCGLSQNGIANKVAIGIIDTFKIVEIG